MALGFKKKGHEEIVVGFIPMNAPFAFVLGKDYKTNRAILRRISEDRAIIEIPMDVDIPDLKQFDNIPMAFRLPGDQDTWNCAVDVNRIYPMDEHDSPVYGIEVIFRNFTKEQKMQIQAYLLARKNAAAGIQPQSQQ